MFFRVVSTQATEILSLSVPPPVLTWTNTQTTSDCSVEICHALGTTWYPVTYPEATNPTTLWPVPTNRPYRLGFMPYPYNIGTNAPEMETIFSNVYRVISQDGDMICEHFDDGIPWPEALSNQAYHANYEADIADRKARLPAGHKVYLSMTPINTARTGIALYRGANTDMALPSPWDAFAFDDPNVKTAFVNHCERMITEFAPDYLAIGIEVNRLMENAPASWDAYKELNQYAYEEIKKAHSNLPVFASLTGMDLLEGYSSANHSNQLVALQDVMAFSDCYGLSLHCIMSDLLADVLPSRALLQEVVGLTAKPVVISATSYPAEVFSIYGGSFVFNGSPAKQDSFFRNLFSVLDERGCRLVINSVPIDYDGLWNYVGQPDDTTKLWRDTGLYDGVMAPRPALRTWKGKQFLPPVTVPSPAVFATDQLVFDSDRAGGTREIYRMTTNGTDAMRLTYDQAYENWWPRISPDREKVLFYRAPPGQSEVYSNASLWVMNADGTGVKRLRAKGDDGWLMQGHGEWSPDGTRIAMFGTTGLAVEVFVTDADGKNPVQYTSRGGINTDVSWSPDTSKLLFNGYPPETNVFEIYVMPATPFAAATRLTANTLADYDPYFSPDGSNVAWLVNVNPAANLGLGRWARSGSPMRMAATRTT